MFTKDKAGWVENAAQEPALVAAMKGRPFDDGERRFRARAPAILQPLAVWHLGRAEADRKLQVSGNFILSIKVVGLANAKRAVSIYSDARGK